MMYRLVDVVMRLYIEELKKRTVYSVSNITFWLIFFSHLFQSELNVAISNVIATVV